MWSETRSSAKLGVATSASCAGSDHTDTSLYHVGDRYMDPSSWNRYVNSGDDPVNFTDPTGQQSSTYCLGGMLGGVLGLAGAGDILGVATEIGTATLSAVFASTVLIGIGVVGLVARVYVLSTYTSQCG